jgi:hypothetical protein
MIRALVAIIVSLLPPNSSESPEAMTAKSLIVVSINPESRVKADRGPAAADLELGIAKTILIKVVNEAGVTADLRVGGPGIGPSGWLDVQFAGSPRLKGESVQFLELRLTAREAGRREATFRFDVGQGTQDLGFRAETPVLFKIRKP